MGLDLEEDNVCRSASGSSDRMCTSVMDIEDSHDQSLLRLTPKGKSISGVSNTSLSCWYTNATSLNTGKLNDLRAECIDTDYDIRFVTETWFNQESVVNIDGYDCFRRDRTDKKVEGSVYMQKALRHSASGKPIMTN